MLGRLEAFTCNGVCMSLFHLSHAAQKSIQHTRYQLAAIAASKDIDLNYKMQARQQSPFLDDIHRSLYQRDLTALNRRYVAQHNTEQVPADVMSRLKHIAFSISHKQRQGLQRQSLQQNMIKKEGNQAPVLSSPAATTQAQVMATKHDVVENGLSVTQRKLQILPTDQLLLPHITWQSVLSPCTRPTPAANLVLPEIEADNAHGPSAMANSSPLKGKGNASQYDFGHSPAHASDAYTLASPRSSSPVYWLQSSIGRPNFFQPSAQPAAPFQPPRTETVVEYQPQARVYAVKTPLKIANEVRDKIIRLNTVNSEAEKLNIEFCHFRLSVSLDINEILLIRTGLNGISMALANNDMDTIRGSVRHAAERLQHMLPLLQEAVRTITQWIVDPEWRWIAQWRALNTFYDCFSSLKARLARCDKMYPGTQVTLVDELKYTRAQVLEFIKPQSDDELAM